MPTGPQASFALRHLRPVALKGIGRVRLWVLRRGEAPGPVIDMRR